MKKLDTQDFPTISVGSGLIALALSAFHWNNRFFGEIGRWYLITWLGKSSYPHSSEKNVALIQRYSVWAFDAENVFFFLGYLSVVFACTAVYCAIRARKDHLPTLYPAVGCILGVLSFWLFHPMAGFIVLSFVAASLINT